MAKDYFQDIVPPTPEGGPSRPASRKLRVTAPPQRRAVTEEEIIQKDKDEGESYDAEDSFESNEADIPAQPQSRGIRSINMPTRPRYRNAAGEIGETAEPGRPNPRRSRNSFSKIWLWILVAICVVVLGFLSLFLFKQTTVTITPRSQDITFDQTSQFMAYPAGSAATGTIAYTVASIDLSASETVASNGMTATQSKASGSITVYNNYSATSVKLIKNTRFQTPSGLIYRTPTDIVVPGKQGSTPGKVTATVEADQTGPQYNSGPIEKLTIPGLQTANAAMYAGMYAESTGGMTGGASGTQQGVAPDVRQAAVADIRSLLTKKAAKFVQDANTSSSLAFAGLTEISFSDMPDADASSSQVVITESAHVSVPVFDSQAFTSAVAQTMAIDSGGAPLSIIAGAGYGAQPTDATPVNLGSDPIDFALVGSAKVIWSVDTSALTKMLAGRDQGAFKTIIGTFPGIDAASARIEPFWKNSFPSDPSAIKVIMNDPASSTAAKSQ